MLRGRRLPLPQSPLSRWRTTAPAPRLRPAPATASFFSTTAIRRNDNVHDERPTAASEREHGKARQKSRLRIHKIGVYGDDWAFLQERRRAQPTTKHIRLSLQGKNPFGDRGYEYEQHVAAMNARKQSRRAPQLHEPPQEAKEAEDYHFRSLWSRPTELKAVERHMAGMDTMQPRHKVPKPRDVLQEAKEAGDYYFVSLEPRDNERRVIEKGKGIYLRRLWGRDDAPSEVARKHQTPPLRRVLQLQDESQKARQETPQTLSSEAKDELHDEQLSHETPRFTEGRADVSTDGVQGTMAPEPGWQASDGHRTDAHQPQGATDPRVGLGSRTEQSPKGKEAVTRRYKLGASEWKPLFNLGLSIAPEVPSLQASPQAKPFNAVQPSGELPVAAADIGPAESFQRSFTEDPVLMKAKSLARMLPASTQLPSRLEFHRGPRFRLLPFSKSTPGKMSPQPSQDKSKTLESHMSELQIKDETKLQPERPHDSPVKLSTPSPSKPEATNLEGSKAADDAELKAAQDELQADVQGAPASEEKGSGAGGEGNALVEAVQPPAPDKRSIFEKLFADQERTKGTDYGQLSSKLKTAFSAAKRAEPSTLNRQDVPEVAARGGLDPQHGLSIFRQLFPEQAESETEKREQETPRATRDLLHPPEDSVMFSLRNQVRNWLSEEGQDQTSWPKPGDYGSHSTVVVISGTSPSLMDTDFYRIAPEGQHVEGWAGGLVKVIQAHDSISYEPLGQYYLMFHSRAPALAYVNEVWRLHELSRKLLHTPADSGREVAKGSLDQAPTSPQPFLTDEERVAVRSFTLCSPHVTPAISVRIWNTELVKELAAKSNIADVLPTLRPEGSTPARVLLKLTSPDGQHGESQGGLTADELWLTLRDDGRERSAPWMLASLSEGIMPVKPKFISEHYKITVKAEPVPLPLELGGDHADGFDEEHGGGPVAGPPPPPRKDGDRDARSVDRNERFRRFVLTFTQPAIARRFVRCWHKRVVYDALLDRSVVVDAVAIM